MSIAVRHADLAFSSSFASVEAMVSTLNEGGYPSSLWWATEDTARSDAGAVTETTESTADVTRPSFVPMLPLEKVCGWSCNAETMCGFGWHTIGAVCWRGRWTTTEAPSCESVA